MCVCLSAFDLYVCKTCFQKQPRFIWGGVSCPFVSPRSQPRGPEEGQRGAWEKRLDSHLPLSSRRGESGFWRFVWFVLFSVSFNASSAPGALEGRCGAGRGGAARPGGGNQERVVAPAASGQQGAPSLCLKPRCLLGRLSPRCPRPRERGGSEETRKARA